MAESMSVCASNMRGACTLSSLKAMHSAHEILDAGCTVSRVAPNGCRMVVRAAGSQKGGVNPVKPGTNQPGTLQGGGTRYVGGKKVSSGSGVSIFASLTVILQLIVLLRFLYFSSASPFEVLCCAFKAQGGWCNSRTSGPEVVLSWTANVHSVAIILYLTINLA